MSHPSGSKPRDVRLRGLSSEHHAALVWARRLRRGVDREPLAERFARELEPHFAVEERWLAPALVDAGQSALATRLLAEHALLRRLVASEDHAAFAEALFAHVRFEERELFPACERLPAVVLEAVARACPKPSSG